MDFFVPVSGISPTFNGSTLVLPQPSLGAVPQLAADLLVHTLKLKLVGYLAVRDTIPVVSGLDFVAGQVETAAAGQHGITFAVQVYQDEQSKFTLVLPRAPVIRARNPNFLASLKEWITTNKFRDVLVASSVDAATRGDDGIREVTPFRHFVLSTASEAETELTPLVQRLTNLAPPYTSERKPGTIPGIPHGGLTRTLLESLDSSASTTGAEHALPPVAALLVYAAEGDNAELAFMTAEALVRALDVVDQVDKDEEGRCRWLKPRSWEAGLMGEELGRDRVGEMYG